MKRWIAVAILVSLSQSADATWDRVKLFLHDETQIVEETTDRLVIAREVNGEQLQIVFTKDQEDDSDVYGDYAMRRGGNPYRIWIISEQLEADAERPRRLWGGLLQADFLRILRRPPEARPAR